MSSRPRLGFLIALALLAGLLATYPAGVVGAATVISDCSDADAVEAALEGGGSFAFSCGVVTITFGDEILIDRDTTIDGGSRVTFSGNAAHRVVHVDGTGGGVAVTLRGLAIVDGVTDDVGGGIYNDQATLNVESCIISGNQADAGGGIYSNADALPASLTVLDSTVSGNFASILGGGVYSFSALATAETWVTRSTISGNSSATSGGGLLNNASGYLKPPGATATMSVSETTVSGNTAAGGAAIENDASFSADAQLAVENSTISGNTTTAADVVNVFGFQSSSATVTLRDSTVAGNTPGAGRATIGLAAVASSTATVSAWNTIVADNAEVNCQGSGFTSLDYNLDDDGTCGFGGANDIAGQSAGLAALADNGGPTETMALLADSPAIDAGDGSNCPTADQRGIARPQDGDNDGTAGCDIGAFERRPTKLFGTTQKAFPGFNRVQAGDPVYVYFTYDSPGALDILEQAVVATVSCRSASAATGGLPAASANGLQYQSNRSRYLFVWKTDRAWFGTCRQLVLSFADGGELRLNISFFSRRR